MHTWTNMAAPDDPYRTGQLLYRRPCPMLAAFTVARPADASHPAPAAIGIVYLPLHRTQMLAITEETLTFGFRAASATCAAETPLLAAVADVDLLQARRHAAVLAGHRLPADLHVLRKHMAGMAMRGLAAVAQDWADRHTHRRSTATMIDSAEDLPAPGGLAEASRYAHIASGAGCSQQQPTDTELIAARTVERALVIALACARHLRRYHWPTTIDTRPMMVANTWDCFPHLTSTGSAADAPPPTGAPS